MKDDQATGEAFCLQKRTSYTLKHEIFKFFSLDPHPDPADQNECGSRSTTQNEEIEAFLTPLRTGECR